VELVEVNGVMELYDVPAVVEYAQVAVLSVVTLKVVATVFADNVVVGEIRVMTGKLVFKI